jgi:hypothetical protein
MNEGNGWLGLSGSPLVKIFQSGDECVDIDSAQADSLKQSGEEITCGSVLDNRDREMAAVRRPSDRCYVVLSRDDDGAVGGIAETLRFADGDKLVAPLGMEAPKPFSFIHDIGILARTSEWSSCLVIRNASVRAGTPLTLMETASVIGTPSAAVVGEPDPAGCGIAPAGQADGSDTLQWYAYSIYDQMSFEQPFVAVIGEHFTDEQMDSLRVAQQSLYTARNRTEPEPMSIDVDRDGIREIFTQRVRGDSIVYSVTHGGGANQQEMWRASFPNIAPVHHPVGPNSYTTEYVRPRARKLPVKPAAVLGSVSRNRYGAVCLTIANPRLPLLSAVDIIVDGTQQKLARATVAWRPPGGCSPDDQAGTSGYGLMLSDTSAFAVGARGIGVIDGSAARMIGGRVEVDVDHDGIPEALNVEVRRNKVVLNVVSRGQRKPRWRMELGVTQ